MESRRRTQSEIAAAKKAERQDDMDRAIAAGKLVVRQMTPAERAASDARRAASKPRGETRRKAGGR